MKLLLLLLPALLPLLAAAQAPPQNPRLKHELDSIYAADQQWRRLLFDSRYRRRPDSLAAALGVPLDRLGAYVGRRMQQADSANQLRVRALVRQYGYPGRTLVGTPTNEAAWSVLLHSDDIGPTLPLVKKAAARGELPFYLYAQMLDRQLMRQGKAQRYGTQGFGYSLRNPATGQREAQPPFIWPVRRPRQVNARRRKAGFTTTVEQNAASLGIPYRVLTLKDVEKMPKN